MKNINKASSRNYIKKLVLASFCSVFGVCAYTSSYAFGYNSMEANPSNPNASSNPKPSPKPSSSSSSDVIAALNKINSQLTGLSTSVSKIKTNSDASIKMSLLDRYPQDGFFSSLTSNGDITQLSSGSFGLPQGYSNYNKRLAQEKNANPTINYALLGYCGNQMYSGSSLGDSCATFFPTFNNFYQTIYDQLKEAQQQKLKLSSSNGAVMTFSPEGSTDQQAKILAYEKMFKENGLVEKLYDMEGYLNSDNSDDLDIEEATKVISAGNSLMQLSPTQQTALSNDFSGNTSISNLIKAAINKASIAILDNLQEQLNPESKDTQNNTAKEALINNLVEEQFSSNNINKISTLSNTQLLRALLVSSMLHNELDVLNTKKKQAHEQAMESSNAAILSLLMQNNKESSKTNNQLSNLNMQMARRH